MLIQNRYLPYIYRKACCDPVQKGRILFADAHHDTLTGNMKAVYQSLVHKDYDIARARLGKPYRLPTYTEIDRLFKNCSEEFVKIPRKLNSVDENGVPLWLQGQWMWQHVIHTQKKTFGGWLSVKIDGLLVNVLSSEGKVLVDGL